MDRILEFVYESKSYTATVVHDEKEPFYYWVLLTNHELKNVFGEDLAFYKPDGHLVPVDVTVRSRNPILFDEIHNALENLVLK